MRNIETNTKDSFLQDSVEEVCKMIEKFDAEKSSNILRFATIEKIVDFDDMHEFCEVTAHIVNFGADPIITYSSGSHRVFAEYGSGFKYYSAIPEDTSKFDEFLFDEYGEVFEEENRPGAYRVL